jgi:hypothetical protein
MKRLFAFLLLLAAAACLVSCGKKGDDAVPESIAGKTYVWEKEGFGGDFYISLLEDGTYQYYEGFLSSFIGLGEWTVEDGVLILTDNTGYGLTFRFRVEEDRILYMAEGSGRFGHARVEDGDAFLYREDAGPAFVVDE